MLRILQIGFLLLVSTNYIYANTLDTYITINRFFQIETKQNYIELSYFIPSNVVEYKLNENNKIQAKLKISLRIIKDDKEISSKVYVLQSQEFNTFNDINSNLKDVIKLLAPANDTVSLKIDIMDINNVNSSFNRTTDIYIPEAKNIFLSDIMLISKANKNELDNPFNRNGLLVMPKFLNYYPTEITDIKFYCEFYQLKQKQNYFVRYLLTNEDGIYVDGYASHKRIEKKSYDAIISGFDISKLPSGNYYLYIELKDENNEIVEIKRTFFQRNNKNKDVVKNKNIQKNELEVITNNFARKYNLANIRHHCLALAPISSTFERATLESFKNSTDTTLMQNYFFSFWKERNPKEPEAEWMAYAKKLQFVEKTFTTISNRGYETARGVIYLTFGKPEDTKLYRKGEEFWLWNYEKLNGQGNVYFIFVNKDKITDDFVLEHTSLKGQIHSKKWSDFLKNEM